MRGIYLGNGVILGLNRVRYLTVKLEDLGFVQGGYVDFDPCGLTNWFAENVRPAAKINKG